MKIGSKTAGNTTDDPVVGITVKAFSGIDGKGFCGQDDPQDDI